MAVNKARHIIQIKSLAYYYGLSDEPTVTVVIS